MRILIDIGHPAHVHYYKNIIRLLTAKGYKFLIIARNRECIHDLLHSEHLDFIDRGRGSSHLTGKIFYALKAEIIILYYALRFRPDLFLSHGSHYATHVAWLLRKPAICTGDSDHIKVNAKILIPFIKTLLTPSTYKLDYGSKQIYYDGFTELLYLHPAFFRPNMQVLNNLGISRDERYFIVRFVSWNAFHDEGQSGLNYSTKLKIIEELVKHGRVIISSEKELPVEIKKYEVKFPSNELHNLISGADLYVGEGATTASEAAILGVPSVYVNSLEVCYCTELQEKYSLCYNFRDEKGLLGKICELIADDHLKEKHRRRREKMLSEKINVTAFLAWLIENYPLSHEEIRNHPEIQYKFR